MSKIIYKKPRIFLKSLRLFRKSRKEKLASPGIVEAEHCYTSGIWKVWDHHAFSNGRLINNEDPKRMGQAASSSTLYLDFQGIAVSIIYRQDCWYGILTVEIDEKAIGTIDQKGPVRNQVETFFKAGEMGPHSLVLRGSKKTGVITVDAILIHGN